MPAGSYVAWVPPPGWPPPPEGWSPPPGWYPDPAWPDPPADWQWWQERFERRRFLRAWWVHLTLVLAWTAGNLALAIGLWQHERAWRHFFTGVTVGASFHNPVGLVMSAALLLTACGLVIVGSWFVVFGVRGTSLHHWLPPVGLSVLGVCMDGFLFVVGPFADTGWWDSARFDESDQMLLAAALASATAFIGLAVAGLSSRQRLAKTQRH